MKILNKNTAPKMYAPERIIQFGEGNFLRAFVDWIVNEMDEKTSSTALSSSSSLVSATISSR